MKIGEDIQLVFDMMMMMRVIITIAVLGVILAGVILPKKILLSNSLVKISDPVIAKYFSQMVAVKSFRAESKMYDLRENLIGKSMFWFQDTDKWKMSIEDGGIQVSDWEVIGKKIYIKDFNDGVWWEAESEIPKLTSKTDFRVFAREAESNANKISYRLLGDDNCGSQICTKYQVLNPDYASGREQVRHFLWFDKDSGMITQEEYHGDTGRAKTIYTQFDEISVVPPKKTKQLIKNENIFILPGSLEASSAAGMVKKYSTVWPFVVYRNQVSSRGL